MQALINALPEADTITEENAADVKAQYTRIDDARLVLAELKTACYVAAAAAWKPWWT